MGERYGYRLHSKDGFNYITGGGGIVFSLPTVEQILKFCSCPSLSSPDDMILGSCLNRLKINVIHSPRFHQVSLFYNPIWMKTSNIFTIIKARPPDYSPEVLAVQAPISFHKFIQLDPLELYEKWFRKMDEQ